MNSAPKLVNWIAPQKDGQSCIFRYYWVETLPQSVLSSFVDPEKRKEKEIRKLFFPIFWRVVDLLWDHGF